MPETDTLTEQVGETIQNDSTVQAVVETVEMLRDTPVSEWLPQLVHQYLVPFAIKLVVAIIVLIIGRWLIKIAKKWMANGLMSRKGDPTLHKFLSNLISFILNFILIIFIISILGVNTSSLVALLASAGLAIGMALSGTLQNFAGRYRLRQTNRRAATIGQLCSLRESCKSARRCAPNRTAITPQSESSFPGEPSKTPVQPRRWRPR